MVYFNSPQQWPKVCHSEWHTSMAPNKGIKFVILNGNCFYAVLSYFQFVLHGTEFKTLHKELGVECLPQELGGKLKPTDELAKVLLPLVFFLLQTKPIKLSKIVDIKKFCVL